MQTCHENIGFIFSRRAAALVGCVSMVYNDEAPSPRNHPPENALFFTMRR